MVGEGLAPPEIRVDISLSFLGRRGADPYRFVEICSQFRVRQIVTQRNKKPSLAGSMSLLRRSSFLRKHRGNRLCNVCEANLKLSEAKHCGLSRKSCFVLGFYSSVGIRRHLPC